MTDAARFQPPRLLRNPHLQSVLGASGLRRLRGERALASSGATTREQILDGGHGVRLQGWHSQVPGATGAAPRCCCTAGKAVPNRPTCAWRPRACWPTAWTWSG